MPDAFDVFNIEPHFDIDLADLDRRQRRWLAELHPNRRSTPALELMKSNESFAKQGEIHEAYRQLRDPVTRAELLLERRGYRITLAQSPELLTRIFEQREAMEQALMHGDLPKLSACVGGARARQAELNRILVAHFDRHGTETGAQPQADINLVVQELRYLSKIVQRGEQALDDLA
jgi:molecular chaperone HscB